MNKGMIFLLFLVLCIDQTYATIYTPIDSTVVKRVELSSRFQNRIAVNEGRINQLVYPGCNIDINLDEETGQVFIYALSDFPEPSSLSVIIEGGKVQDFELVFIEKPGEIVILEEAIYEDIDFASENMLLIPGSPEDKVDIIRKIMSGDILEDFVSCDIMAERVLIRNRVRAVLISKFVSLYETLYVWRVENVSKKLQVIKEIDMNFQCGNWVYLDQHHLSRGMKTLAIVGVRNDETVR